MQGFAFVNALVFAKVMMLFETSIPDGGCARGR